MKEIKQEDNCEIEIKKKSTLKVRFVNKSQFYRELLSIILSKLGRLFTMTSFLFLLCIFFMRFLNNFYFFFISFLFVKKILNIYIYSTLIYFKKRKTVMNGTKILRLNKLLVKNY